MSIASEITRIRQNISAAYTSCGEKGATLPQTRNSANLASAIDSIPAGVPVDTKTYDQRNEKTAEFISEVAYDPSDYSTSSVSTYASATTSYNKSRPSGVVIAISEAGTLTITDGSRSLSYSVSAGNHTVYNITPGTAGSYIFRNSNGEIKAAGLLKPTGALRMIQADNLVNVRDLGGWECDGGTVKYGRLFRGCELTGSAIPSAQLNNFGKKVMNDLLGIDYECDLRWDNEIYGPDGIPDTADDIRSSALGDHVEYCRFPIQYYYNGVNLSGEYAELTKECLLFIMERVIRGDIGYFHCMYGRDRTGTLACILLALLGVSQSDIDKDYELTSMVGSGFEAYRSGSGWSGLISYLDTFSGNTLRDKVANWAVQLGIPVATLNAFRAAMIDGTAAPLTPSVSTFTVTNTLTRAATDNVSATATQYQPYRANITPDSGYLINSIVVTMGGTDITDQVFQGTKVDRRYYVESILDPQISLSNQTGSVKSGESYATFVSAEEGYKISTVQITMGGVTMSNCYSDGAIIIPQVTGNVTITVTAEAESLLPSSYTEVPYIENPTGSGDAYCDIGVTGKTGYTISGKAQMYASGDVFLFGSYDGTNRYIFGPTAYLGGSSNTAQAISLAGTGTDFDFEFVTPSSGAGSLRITVGSTAYDRSFSSSTSFDNHVAIGLFCRRNNNVYERNMKGRIYRFMVKEGDDDVVNLIPCKRNSDNVAGFYDTVSGNFLTSLSATAFVAGAQG